MPLAALAAAKNLGLALALAAPGQMPPATLAPAFQPAQTPSHGYFYYPQHGYFITINGVRHIMQVEVCMNNTPLNIRYIPWP